MGPVQISPVIEVLKIRWQGYPATLVGMSRFVRYFANFRDSIEPGTKVTESQLTVCDQVIASTTANPEIIAMGSVGACCTPIQ